MVLEEGNPAVTGEFSTQMTTCAETASIPYIPKTSSTHSFSVDINNMSRVYSDNHSLTVANPSLGTNWSKCKLHRIHIFIVGNMPSIFIAPFQQAPRDHFNWLDGRRSIEEPPLKCSAFLLWHTERQKIVSLRNKNWSSGAYSMLVL